MENICPSCHQPIAGNYCSNCGEKKLTLQERTFRYYAARVVNAITFAETKMLRTLWLILSKPGTVTSDFRIGRRVVHSSPIALFFIVNLIYFLFPFIETFNTNLQVQTSMMPYSSFAEKLVNNKIERRGITLDDYSSVFNTASTSNAKLMLIIMVFIVTLGLTIICRKKENYFGDYFIFALEINIYNLLVNTIVLALVTIPLILLFRLLHFDIEPYLNDKIFTLIIIISLSIYLYSGIRRAMQFNKVATTLRVLLMIAWIALSLQFYRFLLFMVTYYTT